MRLVGLEESNELTYDVVVCSIEFLEETGGTPTTSDDDQSLLCRIVGKLEARGAFLISDVIETCPSKDHGANGESADCSESSSPSGTNNLAREMRQNGRKGDGFVETHMCRLRRGGIPRKLNRPGHAPCQRLSCRIAKGRHLIGIFEDLKKTGAL